MVGGDFGSDVEERVLGDPEFGYARLRLHLGLAEMTALRLAEVLGLGRAGADLDGDIAVATGLTARDDLNIVECQEGDRHEAAVLLEDRKSTRLNSSH